MSPKKVLEKIEAKLQYHPGDAPWSCVQCYHGDGANCVEKQILVAAKAQVKRNITHEAVLAKARKEANDG